jgi:hypothetical protein
MLEFTIAISDTVPSSVPDVAGHEVQMWRDGNGNICAYCYTVDGQHWMNWPGVACFCLDRKTRRVEAIAHPSVRHDFIADVYRRTVMPLFMQAQGIEVLHASAVLARPGVVAFCAHSGTGKSTLAFGLHRRGYPLWADDTVSFDVADSLVRLIPLPSESRLQSDAAEYFTTRELAKAGHTRPVNVGDDQKKLRSLAALVVLKRTPMSGGKIMETVRLSPREAYPTVLSYALYFNLADVERRRRMIEHYLDLITQVPVFELRFQPGLEHLPSLLGGIERVIDRL